MKNILDWTAFVVCVVLVLAVAVTMILITFEKYGVMRGILDFTIVFLTYWAFNRMFTYLNK